MTKLIACVNVFEEAAFLEGCLRALKEQVDKIVVVDGAYRDYPHGKPYSTDGTVEIARQYADVVIETKRAWYSEIVKRNRYIKELEIGDYAIVIDGDEILEGDVKPQLIEPDYQISLARIDCVPSYPIYRIFKMREGLRYWKSHATLFIKGRMLNRKSLPVLKDCRLKHLTSGRNKQRQLQKQEYYDILTRREKGKSYLIPA